MPYGVSKIGVKGIQNGNFTKRVFGRDLSNFQSFETNKSSDVQFKVTSTSKL